MCFFSFVNSQKKIIVATPGRLMDLLMDLNAEEGTALVLVTHDPALAARMSRRYRLVDGMLTAGD